VTGYQRPGLATRLAAAFHGEVGAATVEAYRRAGAAAYSDQADAERVRSELVLSGRDIWTALPHQASQLLCAWNAFALQTLGDELVEADYRADPRTPIQQFAFDVSAEPMLAVGGGEFARHLVLGPFHASSQVDYGDRGSGE
jgi:hypothetical protein